MLKEFLSNLANAFREKLGTVDKINAQDFSNKVAEVYEAGKQAEYDAFWDTYQDYGNRTNYSTAFYNLGWNDNTFKPKYDIRPTALEQGFRNSEITDLVAVLERQGVVLDTSECKSFYYTFAVSRITHLGVIDTRNAPSIQQTFYISSVQTIDEFILKNDGSQTFNSPFYLCSALKDINITGIIGSDFDIKSSPLTKESQTGIVNALSPTVSGKIASFSKSAVNTAFETAAGLGDGSTSEEWLALRATKENWTVTLV